MVSLRTGQPIVFHAGQPDADILSDDMKDLYTYGKVFQTRWVTVHDTATDGNTPFNANVLAKAKGDPVEAAGERAVPPRLAPSSTSTRPATRTR